MPEEREITSPVASNVKNPPWGTEPETPATGLYEMSADLLHEIDALNSRSLIARAVLLPACKLIHLIVLMFVNLHYSVWNEKEAVSMDDLC